MFPLSIKKSLTLSLCSADVVLADHNKSICFSVPKYPRPTNPSNFSLMPHRRGGMKRWVGLSVSLLALCLFAAQAQADSIFTATLSGDSEAPSSSGTGHAWVDYNPVANDITFTLTFAGLGSDATMGHIHFGAAGTSGPPLLWFFPATLMPPPQPPRVAIRGRGPPLISPPKHKILRSRHSLNCSAP